MPDHPHASLVALLRGVRDFQERVFPARRALFDELAEGQSPHTLFITCADSRVSPGTITRQPPGELFVLRNIGNIVPAYGAMPGGVSAAVEYAVLALEVRNIVVCGHSDCGAMKALLDPDPARLDAMPTVRSWLRNAAAARAATHPPHPDAAAAVLAMAGRNVLLQLDHLRTHPAVAARLAENRLLLQGWLYDIGSGTVSVFHDGDRTPRSVEDALAALLDTHPGRASP